MLSCEITLSLVGINTTESNIVDLDFVNVLDLDLTKSQHMLQGNIMVP